MRVPRWISEPYSSDWLTPDELEQALARKAEVLSEFPDPTSGKYRLAMMAWRLDGFGSWPSEAFSRWLDAADKWFLANAGRYPHDDEADGASLLYDITVKPS